MNSSASSPKCFQSTISVTCSWRRSVKMAMACPETPLSLNSLIKEYTLSYSRNPKKF